MEPFHRTITFWVPDRGKNQLSPHQQGQPHTLAQDIGVGKAATEAGFVIELGVSRNTDCLPEVDQKITGIRGSAMGIYLTGGITRNHINGIETVDFPASL